MGGIDLLYRTGGRSASAMRELVLRERERRLIDRLERLDAHLNRCRRDVPLYRDLPKSGDPLERLRHVPPFNKKLFSADTEEACSAIRGRGVRRYHTSGTSGVTFHFSLDREEIALRRAYEQAANSLLGLAPGARHLVIWGGHESQSLAAQFKNGIYSALTGRELRIVSSADRASCLRLAPRIEAHRAGVLVTYPSILVGLCDAGLADILRSYQAILLTGEAVRTELFGLWQLNNLRNRYGTREFGAIAIGEGNALYYFGDRFILEHDESLGLLVTDLGKRIMPMLRYPIGDYAFELNSMAIPEPPWGLPRLGPVLGRVFDTVIGKSGRRYIGTFWTLVMRNVGVDRFRIQQMRLGELEIQYVARFGEDELRAKLASLLAEDFHLALKRRDDIPELANAKQKIVISNAN